MDKKTGIVIAIILLCLLLPGSCNNNSEKELPVESYYGHDMTYEKACSFGYFVGYLAYEHDEPYNSDYEKYPFGWSLEDYDGVGIQSFLDGMNNGYKTGFKAGFNKGWEHCATGKPYLDNMGESYP